MFREHIGIGHTPCPVVESSCGKRAERSVREKDLRRSTEKESLKGSRTESLSERARKKEEKERHSAVSKEKESYKVVEVEVSSSQRTPVLAAGFHWKETFATSIKLQNITQLGISHEPREIKRAKYAKALLAGTSVVLVKAV